MDRHTPGPWATKRSVYTHDGAYDFAIIDSRTEVIAEAFGRTSEMNYPPSEANARLIAAAPELLEAAKHAAMEWRLHGQLTDSCRVLEDAIAKAEGRS